MRKILQANEHINLTAIRSEEEFVEKHIMDSLTCMELSEYTDAERIADVGTGAGFPGIPLAIQSPEKNFVLIDSTAKKLRVISDIDEQLHIENVDLLHARAEEAGRNPEYRETFDLVVSRAVAELNVLVEWCLPLVKVGGHFVAYKGSKADLEVSGAEAAIKKLGGRVSEIRKVSVEGAEDHNLIVIEKVRATPDLYPRPTGQAKNKPIK